jgi:beta-galactosidase beta subunit
MKNILKQLQQQSDYNSEVNEVVKFAKSGELEKLHKTQTEASVEQIPAEEMNRILSDVSFLK